MKVLIFEDEKLASERLIELLKELRPDLEVVNSIKSVEAGVLWLENNEQPELIISDIQLLDGTSFEIFSQVQISCPVIFTTAYDQYAIKAFEVNSVDYLLKPIQSEKLKAALDKDALALHAAFLRQFTLVRQRHAEVPRVNGLHIPRDNAIEERIEN